MKIKKSVLVLLIVTMTTMTGVTAFAAGNTTLGTTKPKENLSTQLKNLQAIQQAEVIRKATRITNTATRQERQQIKVLYTQMRVIEQTNHGIYKQILIKRKQTRGYIKQVRQGKIIYTNAQFAQIGILSDTLVTNVQSIASCTNVIKNDEIAVKASAKAKDYSSIITELTTMTSDRQARGAELTKVNEDLDALLVVLAQGQAVATPLQPSTTTTSGN